MFAFYFVYETIDEQRFVEWNRENCADNSAQRYPDLHAFLENLLGNLRRFRSCILDVRAFCLDELLAKIRISFVEKFQKFQEISEILASLDNRWNNVSPLVRKRCSVDGIKRNSLVVDRTNRTKLVLRTSYVHIRATRYNANGTIGNLLYIGNRVIAEFVVWWYRIILTIRGEFVKNY